MITRHPASRSNAQGKSTPEKPAIKEPGKPLPKEARQSKQPGAPGEFGEGNYKATREYNEGLKRHIMTHDVEREARDAAPRSKEEAADMERAETEGRSHARGDDPKLIRDV